MYIYIYIYCQNACAKLVVTERFNSCGSRLGLESFTRGDTRLIAVAMALRPSSPPGLPPPTILTDPDHPLFRAYHLVGEAEGLKEEKDRLAGDDYFQAVFLKYQELKENTGKLVMVDGHIYEEVVIDEEMNDDTMEDRVEDVETA